MILPEIRNRTDSIMLDLSLAAECAFTGPTSFEPFPSFLLINKELRSKWGYLDNIAEAKKHGKTGQVARTDDKNKNLKRIFELYKYIEPLNKTIEYVHDDV